MIRQRLYNPAQLTAEELKASFIARQEVLDDMLGVVRAQTLGQPCQHMMIIGQRGMGKTTLGLRLLEAIKDDADLAAQWQPVPFHEESYGIGDLAGFWLTALHHLSHAVDDPQWGARADQLERKERDIERLAAYTLAALLDFCTEAGKRLVLFVENFDGIIDQLTDDDAPHALRATLIERPEFLLIGSANSVFGAIGNHGEALYEFFRPFRLEGLESDETFGMLEALTQQEGAGDPTHPFKVDHGRVETVRRLTGGNPRLLMLTYRMLRESPIGTAREDLEKLIDEQTPYFKARIEDLPKQARRVFHCLAEGWKPLLAREVAVAARLTSSHASAQLKQLAQSGLVREVKLPRAKKVRYEIEERFYNIYYLLRFARDGRHRLEQLIAFLHDLFGPTGIRNVYWATLEDLRVRGCGGSEAPHALDILTAYVAKDDGFDGKEEWWQEALQLSLSKQFDIQKLIDSSVDIFDPDTSITEMVDAVFSVEPGKRPGRVDWFSVLGMALTKSGRFGDAGKAFRKANEIEPDDPKPSTMLGVLLRHEGRFENAIATFDRAIESVHPNDPVNRRFWALMAILLKGDVLEKSEQPSDAIATYDCLFEYGHVDDPEQLRQVIVEGIVNKGEFLDELERQEEAIDTLERLEEYAEVSEQPDLCDMAMFGLCMKGNLLADLGKHTDAETAYTKAAKFSPNNPMPWGFLADIILVQKIDGRLTEAERHARRAVQLSSRDPFPLYILSRVLLQQGQWGEASDFLDHAIQAGGEDWITSMSVNVSLSLAIAATFHPERVRALMENNELTERMEPLWHAVREELGEELEPLPAEIMDAVREVRRRFAELRERPVGK